MREKENVAVAEIAAGVKTVAGTKAGVKVKIAVVTKAGVKVKNEAKTEPTGNGLTNAGQTTRG